LGILTLPVDSEESPIAIASHALERAKLCGQDVVILDTAGRTHIDQALMQEIREIRRKVLPHEILLVADSLTGQDAVNIARSFDQYLGITGIILTRMDGDGRGGAALSMRAVTGMPIKAIGTGEKLDALEGFYPRRIADRILGMGDIVSFVEKASETVNLDKAKTIARKMQEGRFDLSDLAEQLRQMQRLGGMSNIISFLPGMRGLKNKIFSGLDESLFKRYISIISSMTLEERAHPEILKHSRKKRISKGSGTNSSEINQLLKMHKKMAELIKVMGKQRGIKGLKGVFGGLISGENRHMDANSLRVLQDVGFPGLPRKK
jgi:signal recognition particle subunit SRP54